MLSKLIFLIFLETVAVLRLMLRLVSSLVESEGLPSSSLELKFPSLIKLPQRLIVFILKFSLEGRARLLAGLSVAISDKFDEDRVEVAW